MGGRRVNAVCYLSGEGVEWRRTLRRGSHFCGGLIRKETRGLHSFTFQLNLSRVCHTKTPYKIQTPPNTR